MSELKEIGGFIVSADPFVQHDNTLSGNGTVNSPLGVVPGYNETVLYSGDRTSAATLTENPTNFDRIRVYDVYRNLYEFDSFTGGVHQDVKITNFTGAPQMLFVQFSGTSDKYYVTKGFQEQLNTWDNPGTTFSVNNLNNTYSKEIITKVVGINRIVNN